MVAENSSAPAHSKYTRLLITHTLIQFEHIIPTHFFTLILIPVIEPALLCTILAVDHTVNFYSMFVIEHFFLMVLFSGILCKVVI